jgi:hypothetical protein
MLIHIFVDRIYLYDDHLVIYLKGTDKRITISDHKAGIVEASLTDKGSENEECGPPYKLTTVHVAVVLFCLVFVIPTNGNL